MINNKTHYIKDITIQKRRIRRIRYNKKILNLYDIANEQIDSFRKQFKDKYGDVAYKIYIFRHETGIALHQKLKQLQTHLNTNKIILLNKKEMLEQEELKKLFSLQLPDAKIHHDNLENIKKEIIEKNYIFFDSDNQSDNSNDTLVDSITKLHRIIKNNRRTIQYNQQQAKKRVNNNNAGFHRNVQSNQQQTANNTGFSIKRFLSNAWDSITGVFKGITCSCSCSKNNIDEKELVFPTGNAQ